MDKVPHAEEKKEKERQKKRELMKDRGKGKRERKRKKRRKHINKLKNNLQRNERRANVMKTMKFGYNAKFGPTKSVQGMENGMMKSLKMKHSSVLIVNKIKYLLIYNLLQ